MNYEEMTKEQLINELYRKDNLIKFLKDGNVEIVRISEEFRKTIEIKEETIEELLNKVKNSDIELYDKEEIMRLMNCKDDKALSILKFLFVQELGTKIGKEYYTNKKDWLKFLEIYKGKSINL